MKLLGQRECREHGDKEFVLLLSALSDLKEKFHNFITFKSSKVDNMEIKNLICVSCLALILSWVKKLKIFITSLKTFLTQLDDQHGS